MSKFGLYLALVLVLEGAVIVALSQLVALELLMLLVPVPPLTIVGAILLRNYVVSERERTGSEARLEHGRDDGEGGP